MIRINLLPLKEAERAMGRRQRLSLIALGCSIVLLFMVVPYVIQGRRLSSIERRTEQVREEISRYNVQVKEVHDLDRLREEYAAKLRVVRDLNDMRVGPARVLDDLSLATPENLWLVDFNEGNGRATLTGLALDNETIARFMRMLQHSPYFVEVDLVETSTRKAANVPGVGETPVSFTRFIVKATIDYFGRGGKQPEDAVPSGNGSGRGQQK